MRNKEALALLKPYGKGLVLNRMRFPEEIRSLEDLNLPEIDKKKGKEQAMANQLIEQLTEKFDISAFKDTYTTKLLKIIEAKAKGKKVKVQKLKIVHSDSGDLLSVLKASLKRKVS